MSAESRTPRAPLHMPRDYKRDHLGRVSKPEFNLYLPRMRCSVCGQWVLASDPHSYADCQQRVQV